MLKEERALVLETLQTWSREDSAGQASDDTWYAATDAAFVAGKVGLTESIPLLQRLDEAAAERQRCYVTSFQNLGYDVDSLRQIVQLSLRRLGVTPAGYSVVFIELRGMQPDWKTPWGRDGRPRADFVEQVQIGSSLPSVIEMIGAPDYARCCWDDDDFDEEHCLRQLFLRALSTDGEWDALFWALGALYAGRGLDVCEYDIDDDMPYTLRVAFFGGRVIKIARLEPVWKETGPRDAELAH